MNRSILLFVLVGFFFSFVHSMNREVSQWESFKRQYGKSYTNQEEDDRHRRMWQDSKTMVQEHNQKFNRGESTFEMEVNEFADLSSGELDNFRGFEYEQTSTYDETSESDETIKNRLLHTTITDEYDWRDGGFVTRVKEQGNCGSCYAFAMVGALETQLALQTKNLKELSEQQIVDCSGFGCNGGSFNQSFYKLSSQGGLQDAKSYPYRGQSGRCRSDKSKFVVTLSAAFAHPRTEPYMESYVYNIGPVVAGLNSTKYFALYKRGVFDIDDCETKKLNHAVLIVGYGINDGGLRYWIVKNSWVSRHSDWHDA
jgi:C1A family cysteine protease